MKYAIFSDIQGNYEALNRFFEEVNAKSYRYFCLGDIVQDGNSFDENRCIELVKNKASLAVRGNHDDKVIADYAQLAKKITPENLKYLASLPISRVIEGRYYLIHAPSGRRVISPEQAKEEFSKLPREIEICFFGHSHQVSLFIQDKKGRVREEKFTRPTQILGEGHKYMINPGGLGLLWGLPQTYMIFDDVSRTLELKKNLQNKQ